MWITKDGDIVDNNRHLRLLNSPGLNDIKVIVKDKFGADVEQEWQYIVRVPKKK